jgi:hypothetical protein
MLHHVNDSKYGDIVVMFPANPAPPILNLRTDRNRKFIFENKTPTTDLCASISSERGLTPSTTNQFAPRYANSVGLFNNSYHETDFTALPNFK